MALGFETALRLLLFPDDFAIVREFLNPYLTPVAWLLGGLAALGAWLGLALQRRLTTKRIAKLDSEATDDQRYAAGFGVFLLTSSVPQIPSILATITFTFGASLLPVLVGIALCSVGVVAQALRVGRLADQAQ